MGTYSVMLVNDENEMGNAIAREVDWKEMGFEIIAMTNNGREALELAKQLKPDVVLTDVDVPFVDGWTLCRELKKMQKDMKVVICSKVSEFENAKVAIYLGLDGYVHKPVHSEELQKIFLEIKNTLNEELVIKKRLDKLDRYYKKSIQKLQSQFILDLFDGRIPKECIEEMCADYDLDLESAYYVAIAFRVDAADNPKEEEAFLLKRMEEASFGGFKIYSVAQYGMVRAILLLEDEKYLNRAVWEVDQICKAVGIQRKLYLTAGIGTVVGNLSDVSQSWKEACDAVKYRLFWGLGQAICISDVYAKIDEEFVMDEQNVSKLLKDIKLGETQDLIEDVDALVEQFRSNKIALNKYQIFMTEVIVELLKLARTYHVKLDLLIGEKFDIYKKVRSFASLEEVEEWLCNLCLGIRTAIRGERKDSAKLLVDSAKQFIHENYSDSALSVEVLCGYLNVSATYFSTIFKRETGKSFVTYLTDVRMEAARELLNNTEDKTYVISAKVGYPEPNYFSYVFKKQYGIAPSKYRAGKMQESE